MPVVCGGATTSARRKEPRDLPASTQVGGCVLQVVVGGEVHMLACVNFGEKYSDLEVVFQKVYLFTKRQT